MNNIVFLDCSLRDGGYYNNWEFDPNLISRYMSAVEAAGVDVVELGFRFYNTAGSKGPCAYATDDFLGSMSIPSKLKVAVMVNASDLFQPEGIEPVLTVLFPRRAADTIVDLVRIACHAHEFEKTLPAATWLDDRGYRVGYNIMQIVDRSQDEVMRLAESAAKWPIEVLYFADSMGSMTPEQTGRIVKWIRNKWSGPIGVHTHDNMGLALANTLAAVKAGATWLDSTVTGMGRGPGNARTEELALELVGLRPGRPIALSPLLSIIKRDFAPMKARCAWGSNPYYYLSGKYGIHPTYIQEMLADNRFGIDDILSVIDYLRANGGKKYDLSILHGARHGVLSGEEGDWSPASKFGGREVLILGNGDSIARHREAIEHFVRRRKPFVIGLNAMSNIASDMIDVRLACHPLRLLADISTHLGLSQPLVTPVATLPNGSADALGKKEVYNYGLRIERDSFISGEYGCVIPGRLVAAYALAVAASGRASRIYLAGFDGFTSEDPRNAEMREVLELFFKSKGAPPTVSITQTLYPMLETHSVYGLVR